MIASLKAKAIGLLVSGLALVSVFFYWQHLTGERDAYQADAERQRDQKLSVIADDISASNRALEELGEQNAEIRAWLDRDVPGGVADWVRELQQTTRDDAVRLPDSTEPSDEKAASTPADAGQQSRPAAATR